MSTSIARNVLTTFLGQLLTGNIPYSHLTRDHNVILDMQAMKKPLAPTDVPILSKFGPQVTSLLDSCWEFDRTKRPSMTQIRKQLEDICAARC